jgi:hypothetical protein
METCARAVARNASGVLISPLKWFGGPLFLARHPAVKDFYPGAEEFALRQLLDAEIIGGLSTLCPVFHLPCGIAVASGLKRADVLLAYPAMKLNLRKVWADIEQPRLEVAGFFHFDCGNGDMRFGRTAKGKLDGWVNKNRRRYAHLLEVI